MTATTTTGGGLKGLARRWNAWLDVLMPLSDDAARRPLASTAPWAVWAVFAVLAVHQMATAFLRFYFGNDAWTVWLSLRAAVEGRDPFDPSIPYVYLPSTLGGLYPFGLLPREVFKLVALVLTAAGIPVAAMLSARLVGLPARSWAAGLLALATAAASTARWQFVYLNLLSLSALVLPVVLAQWRAGRWTQSAWLVGLAVSVKPMLVPLGWFVLLDRRWRPLMVMAGIPLVLSVVGLLLAPDWRTYFGEAVPFLLQGESEALRPALTSILPVGLVAGWPSWVITGLRVIVVVLGVVVSTMLWRRRSEPTLRVVEPASLLLVMSFLSFSAALLNYVVLLLPLLASAAIRGAIARNGVAWVALAVGAAGVLPGWPEPETASRLACLSLLAAFLAWSWSAIRVLRSEGRAVEGPTRRLSSEHGP